MPMYWRDNRYDMTTLNMVNLSAPEYKAQKAIGEFDLFRIKQNWRLSMCKVNWHIGSHLDFEQWTDLDAGQLARLDISTYNGLQ